MAHGLFELRPTLALLFVEEFVQYLIALSDCIIAEVLSEHLTHQFHLRVHRLAVGLNYIRGEHEQRKQKTVPLALRLPLTIEAALERMENCKPLEQYLGSKFISGYVAVKRAEHENFKRVISSWEREFLLLSV